MQDDRQKSQSGKINVPTERERVIAEIVDWLFLRSEIPNQRRLAEEAARHGYDAGYKAGHDAAIEQAAQLLEDPHSDALGLLEWKDRDVVAIEIRALKQPVEAEEKP